MTDGRARAARRFVLGGEHAARSLSTGSLDLILQGDSREVLPHLEEASVDLVHTSPPYNIGKEYKSFEDTKNVLDYEGFLNEVIVQCFRVLKPGGSLFFQTGYSESDRGEEREIVPIDVFTYPLFKAAGFRLWDRIIWHYFGGMSFSRKFKNGHETIYWWTRPNNGEPPHFDVDAVREASRSYDKRNNLWGKNPGNVWIEDRVAFGGSQRATSHIAVYPESITERIIRACAPPDGIVLDPFAGSGTTPAMARSLGRQWIGIEISAEYATEAAVRVGEKQPSEQKTLASSLLKHLVFSGSRVSTDVRKAGESLQLFFQHVPFGLYEERRADLLGPILDSATVGATKNDKPNVWAFFDGVLSQPPSDFIPIFRASRLLDIAYPQRRLWNGVRRYCQTLDLLTAVRTELDSAEDLATYVLDLVSDEPTTYVRSSKRISILRPTSAVRDPTQRRPPTADQVPLFEEGLFALNSTLD